MLESGGEDGAGERGGDVLEEGRAAGWGAGVSNGESETDEAVGLACCERVGDARMMLVRGLITPCNESRSQNSL